VLACRLEPVLFRPSASIVGNCQAGLVRDN